MIEVKLGDMVFTKNQDLVKIIKLLETGRFLVYNGVNEFEIWNEEITEVL